MRKDISVFRPMWIIFWYSQRHWNIKFARESYLDTVKCFARRYSTTKFRISAHDLEIEKGRYKNIPREQRVCQWCNTNMGEQIVEDENHVICDCGLYANIRSKFISALNSSRHVEGTPKININLSLLKANLMHLLSPNTVSEISPSIINQFNQHHINLNLDPNTPTYTSLLEVRSHIINTACSFLHRCLDNRWKHFKNFREIDTRNPKTIIISITR